MVNFDSVNEYINKLIGNWSITYLFKMCQIRSVKMGTKKNVNAIKRVNWLKKNSYVALQQSVVEFTTKYSQFLNLKYIAKFNYKIFFHTRTRHNISMNSSDLEV